MSASDRITDSTRTSRDVRRVANKRHRVHPSVIAPVSRRPAHSLARAVHAIDVDDSCIKNGVETFWQPTGSTVRIAGGSATSAEGFPPEISMAPNFTRSDASTHLAEEVRGRAESGGAELGREKSLVGLPGGGTPALPRLPVFRDLSREKRYPRTSVPPQTAAKATIAAAFSTTNR